MRSRWLRWASEATISDPGSFRIFWREGLVDMLDPTCSLTAPLEFAPYGRDGRNLRRGRLAPWHEGRPIAPSAALQLGARMTEHSLLLNRPMERWSDHERRSLRLPKGQGLSITVDEKNVGKESDRMNRRKFLGTAG